MEREERPRRDPESFKAPTHVIGVLNGAGRQLTSTQDFLRKTGSVGVYDDGVDDGKRGHADTVFSFQYVLHLGLCTQTSCLLSPLDSRFSWPNGVTHTHTPTQDATLA